MGQDIYRGYIKEDLVKVFAGKIGVGHSFEVSHIFRFLARCLELKSEECRSKQAKHQINQPSPYRQAPLLSSNKDAFPPNKMNRESGEYLLS
jgi:hypothetical protein